jgi:signal transduction histidine kinase
VSGPAGGHEWRAVGRRTEDAIVRRILSANADGIVVVDRAGTVCFANPAAEALFGRTAGELAGSVFGFPVIVDATTEVDVVGRSGDAAVVEMRVVDMDWEGQPGYLASMRDITDRRRAEEERADRIRAEAARAEAEAALRARDTFLALAAHELKTPLTRLSLAVQRALRRPARGDGAQVSCRDALRLVDREAAHLSRLVRQLLDAARIDGGAFVLRRSTCDVRGLVERAVATAETIGAGHTLAVRLPTGPVAASVDPTAFGEMLADLLTSAVRYSPAGTAVDVDLGYGTLGPAGPGRCARLVVRDNGPSVPADVRAALTASAPPGDASRHVTGPGVALHLARRLAELHGGRLELEFPDDGGTRVVLSVPLAPARRGTSRSTSAHPGIHRA